MIKKVIFACVVMVFFMGIRSVSAETYDKAMFLSDQALPTLDGQTQYFDVAWPKTTDTTKVFPLVIWMHGSGWYAHVPKSTFGRDKMEALAKDGYVVVTMDYRLSNLADPVHKNLFPAALQDVRCAVKTFRSTKYSNLPIDKNKIVVSGSSAGANMSLMMAALSSKSSTELASYDVAFDSPDCPYNQFSAAVQGAISSGGPSDLTANKIVETRIPPLIYVTPPKVVVSDATKTPPSLNLRAEKANDSGTSISIIWFSDRTSSCVAGGDLQGVEAGRNGRVVQELHKKGSKNFTLTCTGPGGTVTRSVTAMYSHTRVNYLGIQPVDNPHLATVASPRSYFESENDAQVPPLLFIHSKGDATVPIHTMRSLTTQVLQPRGISYDVLEVEGDAHDLYVWGNSELKSKAIDFLKSIQTASSTVASDMLPGTGITTTDALRIRGAAGIHAAYVATQPVGAKGVIVGGPIIKDNYQWFKIDFETGADGWASGSWLRLLTDLRDTSGLLVGYVNGRHSFRENGLNRVEAIRKCQAEADKNPMLITRCVWRDIEIFDSTDIKEFPRFISLTAPVNSSVVTVQALFGAPLVATSSVTGPINVGKVNWGDSTAEETVTASLFSAAGAKAKIKHTYATKGTFTITLTGLDGKTAIDTLEITKVSTTGTATTTYTLADVKSVTKKVVDPIPTAIDDEYTLYRIVLNNGKVHEVKLGFMPVSYRDAQFRNTGYNGDIKKLIGSAIDSAAETVNSAVSTPSKNAFGCNRSVVTKQATGTVACYGLVVNNNYFGGDQNMCGTNSEPKTGCVIKTPICDSGVAKAALYLPHEKLTPSLLTTVGNRLNVSPEVVGTGIAGLWQYKCVGQTTAGTVLGESTNVYSEIRETLNLLKEMLKNLK